MYLDGKPEIYHALSGANPIWTLQDISPDLQSSLVDVIPTIGFQAMAKLTEKLNNIAMKRIHISRIDVWRVCQTTKPEGSADLNLIQASELLLIRYMS